MDIEFFGHAAVGIRTSSGESIILDPYRSGGFGGKIKYAPIEGSWDWVIISHQHEDHNAKDTLSGKLEGDDKKLEARFKLRRISVPHDEYEGERFGGNVDILSFEVDGFGICHLSDVGCSPTKEIIDALGPVDICFLPIGGFYTIGPLQAKEWRNAIAPKITIPIHYKTASIDLDLEPAQNFLDYFSPKMIQNSSTFSIREHENLAKYADILVLASLNQK